MSRPLQDLSDTRRGNRVCLCTQGQEPHLSAEVHTHRQNCALARCLRRRCPGCVGHPGQRRGSQVAQRGGLKMLAGQMRAVIRLPGVALADRSDLTSSMRALTSVDEMLCSLPP